MIKTTYLESYFQKFQRNIIGEDHFIDSGYGKKPLIYADWVASGRLYGPIEEIMCNEIGPMIANPHSFSSETGTYTTNAYRYARKIIKNHVNAGDEDILVTTGTGMTGVLSKLHRLMGLKGFGLNKENMPENQRPIVFISEMEHHSNHVSWMETICDVVIIPSGKNEHISENELKAQLGIYKNRPLKIGSFTACSNVTGEFTNYQKIAKIMHQNGGYCFVDFAASAPYVSIDMHPEAKNECLDAIFFSPHKFLGGPGSCGILLFNKNLYNVSCPDDPGGGNVKWTSPKNTFSYFDDIETREDGGTPGFLQVIRAALAIKLKESMGVKKVKEREEELLNYCFKEFQKIPNLYILGNTGNSRIGCVSFGIKGIHYNLIVRLLNDRFGIQVRGGWSCASTFAHQLFSIDEIKSKKILNDIDQKNLSEKPGWVRLSLHPTISNEKLKYICNSVATIESNFENWKLEYGYNPINNEFEKRSDINHQRFDGEKVFDLNYYHHTT